MNPTAPALFTSPPIGANEGSGSSTKKRKRASGIDADADDNLQPLKGGKKQGVKNYDNNMVYNLVEVTHHIFQYQNLLKSPQNHYIVLYLTYNEQYLVLLSKPNL